MPCPVEGNTEAVLLVRYLDTPEVFWYEVFHFEVSIDHKPKGRELARAYELINDVMSTSVERHLP